MHTLPCVLMSQSIAKVPRGTYTMLGAFVDRGFAAVITAPPSASREINAMLVVGTISIVYPCRTRRFFIELCIGWIN